MVVVNSSHSFLGGGGVNWCSSLPLFVITPVSDLALGCTYKDPNSLEHAREA